MSRAAMLTAAGYGAWVVFCLLITVFNVGDGGVNAHLALLFTGPPAALFSLYLPHGTLAGVAVAGALGAVQWVLIAQVASRSSSRRRANRGA